MILSMAGPATERRRWLRTISVCVAGLLSTAAAAWAQPTNRALLIGASRYPSLAARWQLEGPPNDVERFRELLLRGRFAPFESRDITELAGWPADTSKRPTRANIEKEFHRLAAVAQKGDQVIVLMAGHGSQQPADADPKDVEPDGLDEIFLPADVGKWDGGIQRVTNAISDDEIAVWLAAIRAKGAFVWILFDSCHSGTMTRGPERTRGLPVSELVDPAALARASTRGRAEEPVATLGLRGDDDGIIAMYAAQSSQTTPEMKLPDGEKWHGLFTFTVVELLEQAQDALTYRELIERVNERYRSYPRFRETPAYEGTAGNRAVLGRDRLPARPPFLLGASASDGKRILLAGRLHGIMQDAILAVYPAAGATGSSQLIGYVRVATVQATQATVEPIAFDERPAPDAAALPPGARCRVARSPIGRSLLRVGAVSPSQPLKTALDALAGLTSGTAAAVPGIESAEWIVREDPTSGEVVLEHASTPVDTAGTSGSGSKPGGTELVSAGDPVSTAGRKVFVASSARDPELPVKLGEVVSSIARVHALRGLATTGRARGGDGVRLQTVATVYDSAEGTGGRTPETGPSGRILRPGQYVEFVVRNTGTQAADLTVLFLDGSFGITALYPVPGKELDTRIAPGSQIVIGRYGVNAVTIGQEDLIVIGVPATTPAVSLAVLEQPALNVRTRGEGTRGKRGVGLRGLLATALKGTRDGSLGQNVLANEDEHDITLFSWTTVGEKK